MYKKWYFEVMVIQYQATTHLPPMLRVGWANTIGFVPYPGGGEHWGANGCGDSLYSYGFDGANLWTGMLLDICTVLMTFNFSILFTIFVHKLYLFLFLIILNAYFQVESQNKLESPMCHSRKVILLDAQWIWLFHKSYFPSTVWKLLVSLKISTQTGCFFLSLVFLQGSGEV